jgi:coenzyme PQQ precursor peptide PqqA
MQTRWVKPAFVEIPLGGECTAYAGVGVPRGRPTTGDARPDGGRPVLPAPGSTEDSGTGAGSRFQEVSRATA